jgi:hypothetical protein
VILANNTTFESASFSYGGYGYGGYGYNRFLQPSGDGGALAAPARAGNPLPLILAGSSLLIVMQGQLSQPTAVGFIVVSDGLTLAACKRSTPRPGFRIQLLQPPQPASLVPTA